MDPDPDPAIVVIDLQDARKKTSYYFMKRLLQHFLKIKSLKESQNSRNLFLHDDRRIRIHTSDKWIRIREALKCVDPQHW